MIAQTMKIGDIEVTPVSDGLLQTSLEVVLDLDNGEAAPPRPPQRGQGRGEDGAVPQPPAPRARRRGDAGGVCYASARTYARPYRLAPPFRQRERADLGRPRSSRVHSTSAPGCRPR